MASQQLLQWLKGTSDKLNAAGFAPDEGALKSIMSAVFKGVNDLSKKAPPAAREQLKKALDDNKISSLEADLAGVRTGVAQLIAVIEGSKKPEPAAADSGYKASPQAAPQAAPAVAAEEVEEEEEACDMGDDVFGMMGGMGEEEVYKVTLMQEAPKEEAEAPAPAAPAAAPKAAGGGKEAILKYIQDSLDKLKNPPPADILKGKAMPSIVTGIKNMTGGAPAEIRNKLKAALEEAKVLPNYEADIDALRAALNKCMDILNGK